MRVFIITEGTTQTGIGHIWRCSALYQAFEEKRILPKFIVNGNDSVKELLNKYNTCFFNWIENTEKLYSVIADSDIIIIDSYLAPIRIYENISKLAKEVVYIDDYARLNYPRSIVVNGTIYAEELPYPKTEGTEYLLGSKYIILRKEFWNVPNKEIREEISKVLITFGGSDIRNLTPIILNLISGSYPSWEKHVVIGNAFQNIMEIKNAADNKTIFHYTPNAEEIKNLMLDCDVAISAAGQTINELARCGTPSLVIQVTENQKENIRGWKKAGFLLSPTEYNFIDGNSFMKGFFDPRIRKEVSRIGRSMVDGCGARNIILSLLKKK